MTDDSDWGLRGLKQIVDILEPELRSARAIHPAESVDPARGLGEGEPDEIAAALARPAGQRRHRRERGEVPAAVIHRLGRQMFRPVDAGRDAALVGDPAHALDEAVETPPLAPRPDMAIGIEGDVHDARPEAR